MTSGRPHVSLIDGLPPRFGAYCCELWEFRQVAVMLIQRDLIVRFRQTFFGLAWLLFKPLMLMLVLFFAFGFLAGFDRNSAAPYPLTIFCGVLPWYLFTNAVPDAMNSLLSQMHIMQKTYFPRAIIPLAVVIVDGIEFFVAWLLFVLGCIWYGYVPGWQVVLFPVLCLQLFLLVASIGLWLSVLNVRFRDVGNLVPFLMTIAFFVTPVGYTLNQIPSEWQLLCSMNPLVGIIEGLRWSLLDGASGFPLVSWALSTIITLLASVLAVRQFLAVERFLVDLA